MPHGKGGIVNVGFTCYANAVFQAFRHCAGVEELFTEDNYNRFLKSGCKYNETTKQFANLVENLSKMESSSSIRPNGFWHAFGSVAKGTSFEDLISRQPHDAHEFLMYLLDSLHESLSREITMTITSCTLKTEKQIFHQKSLETWKTSFEKHYSPLVELFFGMFHIQIICPCGNISNRWETFNTLKGVINKTKNPTLLECIHGELNEEIIEGYVCDGCNKRTTAIRKTKVWKLPKNLIVVLKRFTYDGQKIHTPLLSFGEDISLGELFSASSPNKKHSNYTLRSVIDHHGSSQGGHYTAQAKQDKWFTYDDQSIHESDLEMGSSSYILFLEKL